jgi:uncharacterized protein with HEPN domain
VTLEVSEACGNRHFSNLDADCKTAYAVVRALEIISEASRRLPAELKDRHSEIDWVAVAAAGNVYRHEYKGVDAVLIWHTVRYSRSELRTAAVIELERLANE